MNPVAILKQSAADGVVLSLSASGSIKAAGVQDQVAKWLPLVREHKPGIIAALMEAANDTEQAAETVAYFRWRIHFTNKEPLTVSFSPMATHAEALASYPDAIAAEPADRNQHRQSAGADAALGDAVPRCEVEPVAPSLTHACADDRRTCRQCANLKGAVCSVAYPGGAVSAPKGYRPALDLVQRCAGFDKRQTDK